MTFNPLLTPVYSNPFRPPGVLVPSAAKTVMTDSTNVASLLNARTAGVGGAGPYPNNRFTFNSLVVEPVGNFALPIGKLYLLETQDGTLFKEIAQEIINPSQAPNVTTPTKTTPITFSRFSASNPLIINEGTEIVIATGVALANPGQLIAFLEGGRIWGTGL
jgi:hypothetical protein